MCVLIIVIFVLVLMIDIDDYDFFNIWIYDLLHMHVCARGCKILDR